MGLVVSALWCAGAAFAAGAATAADDDGHVEKDEILCNRDALCVCPPQNGVPKMNAEKCLSGSF